MNSYKHTQPGVVTVVTMSIGTAIGLIAMFVIHFPAVTMPIVLAFALSTILFATLTIEIDGERLKWSFGPGLIHKSVNLADIESVEPFRIPWSYGWGIHFTPKGWLYNVSGWNAVCVRLKTGKQFCLGTDEPAKLVAAIESTFKV